jgi:hypothetical protein
MTRPISGSETSWAKLHPLAPASLSLSRFIAFAPSKADRFRMVNSWAGGLDRAIPQLARARRCTGQPASCCMFPRCSAELGSAGRAVMRLAAWAGCRL